MVCMCLVFSITLRLFYVVKKIQSIPESVELQTLIGKLSGNDQSKFVINSRKLSTFDYEKGVFRFNYENI